MSAGQPELAAATIDCHQDGKLIQASLYIAAQFCIVVMTQQAGLALQPLQAASITSGDVAIASARLLNASLRSIHILGTSQCSDHACISVTLALHARSSGQSLMGCLELRHITKL